MTAVRHGWAFALSILILAGCGPAQVAVDAEPPGLIAREELFGNPERAGVRLSPDGSQISYLAPVDGVLNVWVGPADDPDAAQPVTKDTYRGIRFVTKQVKTDYFLQLGLFGH